MNINGPTTLDNFREKENIFLEIANAEKDLFGLMQSKGLLHKDVLMLYHRVREGYENIILNHYDSVELLEIEYFLWKLHYKHIDEFRRRIRQISADADNTRAKTPRHDDNSWQSNVRRHADGYKSFLHEATAFYKNIIKRLRESCGLPAETFPHKEEDSSFSVETKKWNKCQYTCHRFLICIGDLARYGELCKKPEDRKWCNVSTYYVEAARIWPDGGNPHNQLALLATYVGDPFLALYHCVRSLAIREPFPDSWNNLMLLFEENRSSPLHLISNEVCLDFLKLSERNSLKAPFNSTDSSINKNLETQENVATADTDLWPLIVRTISFFLVRSSLVDFPRTFATMVQELGALLALSDAELETRLECYQRLDSSRRGPYRTLQLVSIFIFAIHNSFRPPEEEKPGEKDKLFLELTQLAIATAFSSIGRLVERCLNTDTPQISPVLSSVLVFVEWLVHMLERLEVYANDEKVTSAMVNFFSSFVDLLNRLDQSDDSEITLDNSALWEDYELRGFEPMVRAHRVLAFKTNREYTRYSNSMNSIRSSRIICAAKELVGRSVTSQSWIFYDKSSRKFYARKSKTEEESRQENRGASVKHEEDVPLGSQSQSQPVPSSQSVPLEDEEVILFKPITRHNSAPLYTAITTDNAVVSGGVEDEMLSSEECLRRAASLFTNQSQAHIEPFCFYPEKNNMKFSKPSRQQEPIFKDSTICAAGPPSLNAWVLNKESSRVGKERGMRDLHKRELSPITEIASESLIDLSIDESHRPVPVTVQESTHPYVTPVPSAPLLPEDAVWYGGNIPSFSDYRSTVGTTEGDGILGAPPVSGFSARGPLDFIPGSTRSSDGFRPVLGMSSSEWLYHYRNSHNFERHNIQSWPVHSKVPTSLLANDAYNVGLYNQWGNYSVTDSLAYLGSPQLFLGSPLVYGMDGQRKDNVFLGCTDPRHEEAPLLQYLKEKERQVQFESQLRGPPFMGK